MTLEALNTAAAVGTFLVIAGTVIAAVYQLQHMRNQNQLQSVLTLRSERSKELEDAYDYVSTRLWEKLKDPAYRRELEGPSPSRDLHPELRVCEYFEHVGVYIKHGLIDDRVYFEIGSPENWWPQLQQVIAIYRRNRGPSAFENAEYLVMRSLKFNQEHPDGTYPKAQPRLTLNDPYLEVDRARIAE